MSARRYGSGRGGRRIDQTTARRAAAVRRSTIRKNGVLALDNKQLLPFERNRYYVGKLLTSADFQTEQTYFNNKRRFLNHTLFGDGVVCGLGVYSLDDLSIMVESGVALDSMGREIVLENSVVRKLSAIEGFESLESENACLCLRYAEEAVHPVYAVNRREQDEEYELNRIREGAELFLIDVDKLEQGLPAESEFLSCVPLYSDRDYSVQMYLPSAVACGQRVKLTIEAEKLSDASAPLSMSCVLQAPAFTGPDGSHEIVFEKNDVVAAAGERIVSEIWLTAQNTPAPDSVVIAGAGGVVFRVGEKETRLAENTTLKVSVEALTTDDIIAREVGRISLEMREMSAQPPYIRLADFKLQRTKNAYIIEKVTESGVKSYVHTAGDAALRREYASYYQAPAAAADGSAPQAQAAAGDAAQMRYREPVYATGICEIPIESGSKAGKVFYSDEILHGLGKGDVFVSVGVEYLADDARMNVPAKNTIYGDASLFEKDELPVTFAETAVKVQGDRGSFVVAARLTRETANVLLVLRWVAFKLPAATDKLEGKVKGKSIAAVPPTVVLGTRESKYFNVRFRNMDPCTLTYELTEKDSGEITSDGIYTAPAREGVYEIRITCAEEPLISTYAYAVVKKKDIIEEEAEQ